jgi:hypothetical protein
MLVPQFHFSQIDQELLLKGMVARLLTACLLGGLIGIPATRGRHIELIRELRSNGATDQVVVFNEAEEE